VSLTVKLGVWVAIMSSFEISDAEPWYTPDTLLEATAPVKLPNCVFVPRPGPGLRSGNRLARGVVGGISRALNAPTYPEHNFILPESQRVVKVHGVSLSFIK